MKQENKDFLIINGVQFEIPAYGMAVSWGWGVNGGRNADNEMIGDRVGRKIWKIDSLAWRGLTEEQVRTLMNALQPFTFKVTFRSPDGRVRTHTMYPGDGNAKPLMIANGAYTLIEELKFNLIDCGYMDEKYEDE